MFAKHGNFVDADASGAKANIKHLESRLEVIRGHAFWDHWKADGGLRICNNVGFRDGNFEGNVLPSPFSRTPLSFGANCLRNPCEYSHKP